jgi:hypothetical protein
MRASLKARIKRLEDHLRDRERAKAAYESQSPEEREYQMYVRSAEFGGAYQSKWIREQYGIDDPFSEAVEAYWENVSGPLSYYEETLEDPPPPPHEPGTSQPSRTVEHKRQLASRGDPHARAWCRIFVEYYCAFAEDQSSVQGPAPELQWIRELWQLVDPHSAAIAARPEPSETN